MNDRARFQISVLRQPNSFPCLGPPRRCPESRSATEKSQGSVLVINVRKNFPTTRQGVNGSGRLLREGVSASERVNGPFSRGL